jgi:tetratricopeptide (TPR) repeat protein
MRFRARWIAALLSGWAATGSAAAPATPPRAYPNPDALQHYLNGRLLEEEGEPGAALREYYRALVADPNAVDIARRLSEVSARVGDAARSLEFAERALALDPHDPRLHWLKGAALFNRGRYSDALEALQRAAVADSENAEYQRTLARAAEQTGRTPLVAEAYRRAVALEPEDAESWFQLAGADARLGRWTEAEQSLARARELNAMRPGLLFLEGWIREGQGRRPDAIRIYRDHLEVHANDTATRRRLVELLARENRLREAHAEAARVSKLLPHDALAAEAEADLAFRIKRAADGERAVRRLIDLAGSDPDRALRAVAVLARHDRERLALAIADEWAARAEAPRGALFAAQARALTGDFADAIARARVVALAHPDSLEPVVLLARLHASQKRFAPAESLWFEALARGADTLASTLEIAHARELRGDVLGAEQAVRDALRRAPEHPRVLNFLGYLLADQNRNLAEALELIRRALAQDPDNGAYVDSLGWVYYRLGRLEDARTQLERAVALTNGDPVVHEHLGDVYRDLRLFDLARTQYRLSLALDQSNAKVKAKLAEIR